MIEDAGYEAFTYRNTGARGAVSDMDCSKGGYPLARGEIVVNENSKSHTAHHRSVSFTRAAREGNVPPDLQFQFRLAAVPVALARSATARCC